MQTLVLTPLEADVLEECNKLAEPYNLEAGKYKEKRTTKYCLTQDGVEIIGNTDLVQFHKFCQNEEDLARLSSIAGSIVKNKKASIAKQEAAKAKASA